MVKEMKILIAVLQSSNMSSHRLSKSPYLYLHVNNPNMSQPTANEDINATSPAATRVSLDLVCPYKQSPTE
jgi:hypothetical protein